MSSAENGKSAGDTGFDINELLGKLAGNKGKAKVEPTSGQRQTARELAQQFTAYRDEGFTRAESLHLASLLIRSVYEAQAKDFIEKKDNGGT